MVPYSTFFGCCDRFICLIATCCPVATSTAVKTVPDALRKRHTHVTSEFHTEFFGGDGGMCVCVCVCVCVCGGGGGGGGRGEECGREVCGALP